MTQYGTVHEGLMRLAFEQVNLFLILTSQYIIKKIIQASKAANIGEVPVGCIIVRDGVVIATGHNRTNESGNVCSFFFLITKNCD